MKNSKKYFLIITAIVIVGLAFGLLSRIIPHFPNFAPMGAVALFAAAFYKRKALAFILPAMAWWLSDLYLNNTLYATNESFTWFTYDQLFIALSLMAIVAMGSLLLKKLNVAKVLLGSVSASLIFFIVSNFGTWMQGMLYPKTISGLATCYSMAVPFYKATFVSDLVFTSVFFTAMYFISQSVFDQKEIAITTK